MINQFIPQHGVACVTLKKKDHHFSQVDNLHRYTLGRVSTERFITMYTEQLPTSVWADVKKQLLPYLQSLSMDPNSKNINIKFFYYQFYISNS